MVPNQYIDDYNKRKENFENKINKKITHLTIDHEQSKNYIKRNDHLSSLLDYPNLFGIKDNIVLSSD